MGSLRSMNSSFINGIWYPGTDYVESVITTMVPMLFPEYDVLEPDFQYLGGEQGRGLLASSSARPMPYFGEDRYPTIADKAAALIWSITRNHPFNDGNNRCALTTGFVFLANNGHALVAHQDEAVETCLRIAANTPGYTESYVSSWLQANFVPVALIGDILAGTSDSCDEDGLAARRALFDLPERYHMAWIAFYRSVLASWNVV